MPHGLRLQCRGRPPLLNECHCCCLLSRVVFFMKSFISLLEMLFGQCCFTSMLLLLLSLLTLLLLLFSLPLAQLLSLQPKHLSTTLPEVGIGAFAVFRYLRRGTNGPNIAPQVNEPTECLRATSFVAFSYRAFTSTFLFIYLQRRSHLDTKNIVVVLFCYLL